MYGLPKYFTTILMRDVKAHTFLASASSFPQPPSYQVNVMHTEQPEKSLWQDGLAFRTGQTDKGGAKRNSRKYPYFEMVPPGVNCVIIPGKSHLYEDDDNDKTLPWEKFLMILWDPHYHFAWYPTDIVWTKKRKKFALGPCCYHDALHRLCHCQDIQRQSYNCG